MYFGKLWKLTRRLSRRDWLLVSLIAPLSLLIGAGLSDWLRLRGYVVPGVVVLSVPIDGYSGDALSGLLQKRADELLVAKLEVQVGERVFSTNLAQVGARLDIERLVQEALDVGRAGPIPSRLHQRAGSLWGRQVVIEPRLMFDETALRAALQAWAKVALKEPVEGAVTLGASGFERRYPSAGETLDTDAAKQLLELAVARGAPSAPPIKLPTTTTYPKLTREAVDSAWKQATELTRRSLTLTRPVAVGLGDAGEKLDAAPPIQALRLSPELLRAALSFELGGDPGGPARLRPLFTLQGLLPALSSQRAEIETQPQDARFEVDARDRVTLVPSATGTLIDESRLAARLGELAQSGQTNADLPLLPEVAPKLSTAEAESLNIRGLVSSFATHHACCQPRVKNIHRIAALLDNTVLRPGERYSVNEAVGPRTPANGFLPAPTIVRGDIEDTAGGGVSQFATTLFNAVLHGGYEIIERQPHSYYFERYPIGHEATLSYPKPDLIFRNDTRNGLLIKTITSGTTIAVKLYGDNEGRTVRNSRGPRYNLTEPKTVYEPNDELTPDEEKLVESGQIGWSVEVSRVVSYPDGTKKQERREVTYNPRDRVVQVHSCKIPKGEPGHTGKECPEPEPCDAADPSCTNPACAPDDAACQRMQEIRELVEERN